MDNKKKEKVVILGTAHGKNVAGKRSPDGRLTEYMYSREVVGLLRRDLEGAGLKVIRWSHSLNDSDDTNQVASRSFACATANITPGSIILSHLDSKAMVEALPDILQWYQEHGFEVVPVSELLLQGDVTVDSEGYQVYRKDLK